jgi:hypothetical protein
VAIAGTARGQAAKVLNDAPVTPTLDRAAFQRWLGSTFSVRPAGSIRSKVVTLEAVEDGQVANASEQFHAIFRAHKTPPTGLCVLRHPDGSVFQLHLEAVGEAGAASLCRATFNLYRTV